MGLHQLQSDEPLRADELLRAQRMTADEAASVIALWQQEQTELTGLTDRPAVPDVAEGLDITVEDVQRLLEAVRTQRLEAEQRLAQEQELATAEMRMAEEERRMVEIQQQRTELRQENAEYRNRDRSSQKSSLSEPVPWEVWKAAQVAAQKVETEPDTWKSTKLELLEHNDLENQHESSVLTKVWLWIILIWLGLLICFKWIVP